jgi:RNA polymerase sigma-70 factor (ECF subfamily)
MSLPEPEKSVVRLARAGNAGAFEQIVRLYERITYNLAFRMTYNREDACETVQEVFVRLFRNFDKFEYTKKFGPWFMKLAVNVCINEAKRRSRGRALGSGGPDADPGAEPDTDRPGVLDTVQRKERDRTVRKAIEELDPPYRTIVTLRYLEDLSYRDIGEILDLPQGTVKTRLFRAREALRGKLEKAGIGT